MARTYFVRNGKMEVARDTEVGNPAMISPKAKQGQTTTDSPTRSAGNSGSSRNSGVVRNERLESSFEKAQKGVERQIAATKKILSGVVKQTIKALKEGPREPEPAPVRPKPFRVEYKNPSIQEVSALREKAAKKAQAKTQSKQATDDGTLWSISAELKKWSKLFLRVRKAQLVREAAERKEREAEAEELKKESEAWEKWIESNKPEFPKSDDNSEKSYDQLKAEWEAAWGVNE